MTNRFSVTIAVLVVMGVMAAAGLMLLINAPSLGQSAAHGTLVRNGGSMDTGQYEIILAASITSYHAAGFMLSLIGGLGVLVIGYLAYQKGTR